MEKIKNILKSTVFVGGALGALPAMATTVTIAPNASAFTTQWNDPNVETIRFTTANGPANPSDSRAGGIILPSALPVPPRSKIVDAASLSVGGFYSEFPIDIQTNDPGGRIVAQGTSSSPQVTFRSVNLSIQQATPRASSTLTLDYQGQLNLLGSRLIGPVEVTGGVTTLGIEAFPVINALAQDTNISGATPSFTITDGRVLVGNSPATDPSLNGITAFNGLDFQNAYTAPRGNFRFQSGRLLFDLPALPRALVAKGDTVITDPAYTGNTGVLSTFNEIRIQSGSLEFRDENFSVLSQLTEANKDQQKLVFVVGTAQNAGNVTVPSVGIEIFKIVGDKLYEYRATLVNDAGKIRLEIVLIAVRAITDSNRERYTKNVEKTITAIKNRPNLQPLTQAQQQAIQDALAAMRNASTGQNTTQQGTIPSYTRDTLPAGTIICEFNQIRRAVQGRFGVKGLTLSMTPDHSSQVSRMMAEAGLVRDGALAPLRLLNKTWNLWVSPQGSHGQSKAAVGAPKSRQRSAGANGGLAYKINDQLSAVASFALNQAHSKSKDSTSKSRSDVYSGMAMVRYTPSFYYVDGGITLAPVHTEDRRKHPVAGNPRIRSKSRGYTHGFMAGVGATAPLFGVFLQPRFDYTWTRSMTRAFKDKNGGEFANRTAKMSGAQHQTNLGMDVAKPFPLENGLLGVQVGVYWARYKSAKNPRIRVYSKLMKDVMGTSGWTVDKSRSRTMNNVRASVGGQFVHQKGISVGGQYGYEHGRYMRQHSGMIRVGYAF
ncbi:MAG: autotransporter outer membrane beta-barrel domain-containing protein [Holosporales bacterium]